MRCGCLGAGGKAGDWPTAGKHLKAQQASISGPFQWSYGRFGGGLPACTSTLPVQVTQARSSPCQARRVQPQLTHPPFPFPSTPHPAIYIHPSSSARLPQYRSRHRCRLAPPPPNSSVNTSSTALGVVGRQAGHNTHNGMLLSTSKCSASAGSLSLSTKGKQTSQLTTDIAGLRAEPPPLQRG